MSVSGPFGRTTDRRLDPDRASARKLPIDDDTRSPSIEKMSSPSDYSNNPYNEGGSSSAPPRQAGQAIYFCHQCQADVRERDVLRVPDLTCPQCHGSFLEKIE